MRRLLFLLAALTMLATACSGSDPVADPTSAGADALFGEVAESGDDAVPRVRLRSTRLDAVILGGDGSAFPQLRLLFIGSREGALEDDPCAGEYEAEVDESADEITVTVYQLALEDAEETSCFLQGYGRQLVVELDQPMGDRAVIDGHDGSPQWVIDEPATTVREISIDEDGLQYRATAYGEEAIEELESFVAGLELDPMGHTLEIPFEAPIVLDPDEGNVIPTPTATPPGGVGPQPIPIGGQSDGDPDDPVERDQTWTASESTRDVANYLEALRQGAYEHAAWPAANNGVEFDGQTVDETGAHYLERACGEDLCQGPYLVRGEPGYRNPTTLQGMAAVSVMHLGSGEETTMLLFEFEGQRMITSLPPLVASKNDASLRDSLFGDAVPQRVIVERFDAFEIWEGDSAEWVTNWYAEVVTRIEGDVVATWFGVFGLRDPQAEFTDCLARIIERNGQVLAVDQCVNDLWAVVDLASGDRVDAPVSFEPAGEAQLPWFDERGGVVVTGVHDAEGNLVELRSADGVNVIGDDYASLATISTDGQHLAYVDHRDAAAFSHFWSPVVVVRDIATGTEVGRWTLDGAVGCLEYAVDWVVACELDDATLAEGIPEQRTLVAINPTTGDVNRVDTATQVFLPTG